MLEATQRPPSPPCDFLSLHWQHLVSQESPLHTHPEAHLLQPDGQQEQQPGGERQTCEYEESGVFSFTEKFMESLLFLVDAHLHLEHLQDVAHLQASAKLIWERKTIREKCLPTLHTDKGAKTSTATYSCCTRKDPLSPSKKPKVVL